MMGGARQPSRYRTPVVPRDPLSALRTLRLLFEGWMLTFGAALAAQFVLPVAFGESFLFEDATRIMGGISLGLGTAFTVLLTVTVLRVLWRW